jgi:Ribbon-helix-helix protein, copG family
MAVGYKHRQQIRLGFMCKPELAETLDKTAKARGIPLTELIRQACLEFLAQPQ